MITIKSEANGYGIKFPTRINEIINVDLATVTNNIKLPKYYAIVALAFETKIFDFCVAMNNKRDTNLKVTPILAKISNEDSKEINANVGDKLIIDRSSLERGYHVNVKTAISSNAARNYFNNDKELINKIIKPNTDNEINKIKQSNIILLEFKIVPINAISASIAMNSKITDPFMVIDKDIKE